MKLKFKEILILMLSVLSIVISLQTSTETDARMRSKINISIGKMKLQKTLMTNTNSGKNSFNKNPNAISPTAQVSSSTLNDQVSTTGNLAKTSNVLDVATASMADKEVDEIKLGPGPIYFTGWVKYFKISDVDQKASSAPTHFFKNNYYYDQMKVFPNANMSETSSDGVSTLNTYIKSPSHFYALLFKDNLNIVSSRSRQLQKTFDVLNIESMKPVVEEERIGGNKENGIQDFGNFSEGYCFKVLVDKPQVSTWVICADTKEEKEKLYTFIRKIKIKTQRDKGMIVQGKQKPETLNELINPDMGGTQNLVSDEASNLGIKFNSTQGVGDGYWIVLQDWSQCSLKCGGGISTLQRMCVPPKNGGAACQGEAIVTKPCNIQPCPQVYGTDALKPNNNTIVYKPIIKVMPFSTRPQRYSKCVLKESDLMLTQDVPDNTEDTTTPEELPKSQLPVRMIMNNRTITIFGGDDYETLIKTFALKHTNFKRSAKHKLCFIIADNEKTAELCPFGFGKGSGKIMVDEWDYDFNLFKYQCFKPREKIDLLMEAKLQEKVNEAKKQLLIERESELKKDSEKIEEAKVETIIKSSNQVALQAIEKELNLEEMIRKEEMEREQKEEVVMLQLIEAEKKKSECMINKIKERELENQYNLRAKEAKDQVNNIQQAASQQVLIRRSQLKNQIVKMRKDAMRRKSQLAQQLQTVRTEMAETMNQQYKKGDSSKCSEGLKNSESRQTYCEATFPEDYDNLQFCVSGDSFCELCCDTEFGGAFINERQDCYSKICNPTVKESDVKGRWMWQAKS